MAHWNNTAQEVPETIPQLLTLLQVARALAIGRTKAYAPVESGRLPCIQIDRSGRVWSNLFESLAAAAERVSATEQNHRLFCWLREIQ